MHVEKPVYLIETDVNSISIDLIDSRVVVSTIHFDKESCAQQIIFESSLWKILFT